jgi:hypothetical protein
MHLVAIAWIFVVLLAAAAEAISPQGSVFGALVTFVLYGALPLGIVLYILGTPGRKRRLAAERDAGGHAAPDAPEGLPPERKEP